MSSKYERRYNWLYYSAAKGGYCCKICELFAQESDNIFIKGTTLCFFPILYKTTRKFPILGVGSCSQNAEKKPCSPNKLSNWIGYFSQTFKRWWPKLQEQGYLNITGSSTSILKQALSFTKSIICLLEFFFVKVFIGIGLG